MPRNDFKIDHTLSAKIPTNIEEIIEKIINDGSKEENLYVLESRNGTVFCVTRANTDLYAKAAKEEAATVLTYNGHITFRSASDGMKMVRFSMWKLNQHADSEIINSVSAEKVIQY